jgi:hypothetical protein
MLIHEREVVNPLLVPIIIPYRECPHRILLSQCEISLSSPSRAPGSSPLPCYGCAATTARLHLGLTGLSSHVHLNLSAIPFQWKNRIFLSQWISISIRLPPHGCAPHHRCHHVCTEKRSRCHRRVLTTAAALREMHHQAWGCGGTARDAQLNWVSCTL